MPKSAPTLSTLRRSAALALAALTVIGLAGCSGELSPVDVAQAQVTAAEEAVSDAQAAFDDASDVFCGASEDYIEALDRYGDILNTTETTVGDVKTSGRDLVAPREDAFSSADAALDARDDLVAAQQELVDARAALAAAQAEADPTATPAAPEAAPVAPPTVPTATVERVKQAETEFDAAQSAVTDDTPLAFASEQFNAAAVALEVSWLKLFADAGCLPEEQKQQAVAAVTNYTAALQTNLAAAGYYAGAVDGVYGPDTVAAVEALQSANGLPVTGTVDKATDDALQAQLAALGGAAADSAIASTAAVQQTLKMVGFWDGPVDGVWTPELTEAVKALQTELGVEPTGAVDAATIAALEQAISDLVNPAPEPEPEPEPTSTDAP